MKSSFNIKVLEFKSLSELPDAWNLNDYKTLLDIMEYGDTNDIKENEFEDICLMCLSDNDPEEAALIVLNYIFQDSLNSGQKENLSHIMQDEKMWEEYADIAIHEKLFNAHQILFKAYNGKFPRPEALAIQLEVTLKNSDTLNAFNNNIEATLVRLITQGMPENTLINRLYDEELEVGAFSEAKDIIWQVAMQTKDTNSIVFTLISSFYWFKDLKYCKDFEAVLNRLDIEFHKN